MCLGSILLCCEKLLFRLNLKPYIHNSNNNKNQALALALTLVLYLFNCFFFFFYIWFCRKHIRSELRSLHSVSRAISTITNKKKKIQNEYKHHTRLMIDVSSHNTTNAAAITSRFYRVNWFERQKHGVLICHRNCSQLMFIFNIEKIEKQKPGQKFYATNLVDFVFSYCFLIFCCWCCCSQLKLLANFVMLFVQHVPPKSHRR